jgi:hypothetical protein
MADKPPTESSDVPARTHQRIRPPPREVTDTRTRERAYLIWVDEGPPQGRDLDHWLRAKWELEREPKRRLTPASRG